MCGAGTPAAMTFSTMPATTSGLDMMFGAPEQLTLIPTISEEEMKWDQASRSFVSRVSARTPAESIWRTTLAFSTPEAASIECAERTRTAWPRYGPGIAGWAGLG